MMTFCIVKVSNALSSLFRTEEDYCSIQWAEAGDDSFELTFAAISGTTTYADFVTCSYDYISIPGGYDTDSTPSNDRFCGDHLFAADADDEAVDTAIKYTVTCKKIL